MPPLRPLRQGTEEQRLASAPSRGAAQVAASPVQEPCSSASQFLRKQTRRLRVIQVVFMAKIWPSLFPRSIPGTLALTRRIPNALRIGR